MREFVEFLVKQIVNKPEELKVDEDLDGTVVTINICANKEDMGLIIGKSGKTIKSIRDLAKAKAIKDKVKVYVTVC